MNTNEIYLSKVLWLLPLSELNVLMRANIILCSKSDLD